MKRCLLALTTIVCLGCSRDERTVDAKDNPVVVEYFKERLSNPNKQFASPNDLTALNQTTVSKSVSTELSQELKRFDAKLVEEQIQKDPAFASYRWIAPTILLVEPSQQFEKTSFEKLCARIPQTRPDVDFAVTVNALPLGIGFVHCVRNASNAKQLDQ